MKYQSICVSIYYFYSIQFFILKWLILVQIIYIFAKEQIVREEDKQREREICMHIKQLNMRDTKSSAGWEF